MNPHYNIYEEIDRYLQGEMNEAERADFHARLSQDAELQQLVEAQQLAHQILIDREMIRLKERMQQDLADDRGEHSSAPWGKILLLSAVIGSAALYTYSSFSSDETTAPEASAAAKQEYRAQASVIEKTVEETKKADNPEGQALSRKEKIMPNPATPLLNEEKDKQVKEEEAPVLPLKKEEESLKKTALTDVQQQEKRTFTEDNPVKKNACEQVQFKGQAYVDYTFDGHAFIVIDPQSVKGGTGPYTYSLNGSDFNPQHKIPVYRDGTYRVQVQDALHCKAALGKDLNVKLPVHTVDEAFSPSQGERWKFPLHEGRDATITIYNKAGSMVYSTTVSNGYPEDWDGKNNSGVELETGNYYFVIQYTERDLVKGYVSIIR